MRTKKKGVFLMAVGLLMIAGGIGIAVWNMRSETAANEASTQALEQIMTEMPEKKTVPTPGLTPENIEDIPTVDEVEIPDYILNPDMDMPETTVNGRNYIGTLDIPALGLSLPIISNWSYPALTVAPCRFMGSPYKDDLIIAAHNYACHFGQLKNLSEGSSVIFTDIF